MPTKTEIFNASQVRQLPEIRPGDTVKVHQKIKEGDKERIQVFEGIVIARKHGKGVSGTVTVRKVVEGVGVERIFPVHAPFIAKIEVVKSGKVRRSKLYYLRTAKGRKARLKNREFEAAIAEEKTEEKAVEEVLQAQASPSANTETEEQKTK